MTIKIVVEGKPTPKARARTVSKGGRTWSYTPGKTKTAEEQIRLQALSTMALNHAKTTFKPVILRIGVYLPIPKYLNGSKDPILPIVRPDLDNYAKLVMDALNGTLWDDDGQVVCMTTFKVYSKRPRIEIEATECELNEINAINKEQGI